MPLVQILFHDDTLAVRHAVLSPGQNIVNFHEGFTREDWEAGWRSVKGVWLEDEQAIRDAELEAVAHSRSFWEQLLQLPRETCVVHDGWHYTVHEAGTPAGFGGKLFEVRWLDEARPSVIGHLWSQGRIPAWARSQLPDNAHEPLERNDLPNPFAEQSEAVES